MELYSVEEIQEDIGRLEGVVVKVSDNFKSCSFLKLYSQCYSKPMNGDATVDDLKKRINEFCSTKNVILPPCDIYPNEDDRFCVYKAKLDVNGQISLNEMMVQVGVMTSLQQAVDFVKVEELDINTIQCIVSVKERDITYLVRNLH